MSVIDFPQDAITRVHTLEDMVAYVKREKDVTSVVLLIESNGGGVTSLILQAENMVYTTERLNWVLDRAKFLAHERNT